MRAQPNRVELSARELQDVFETYAVFRYHATNHGQPTTAYAVDAVCAHAHTDTPPAERRHAEGRAVGVTHDPPAVSCRHASPAS